MRRLIETNFGIVLLISCVVGLAVPALAAVPDASASVALAMLTYASCFKLKDGGFSEIRWGNILLFYVVRYIILPIALLLITQKIFPDYAAAIFLLALLPTAVSSPAFANMFGGRVPPAFAIVILSTTLAPFLIPLQCSLILADANVTPTPLPLFRTLAFCVFVPMILYFATRSFTKFGAVMYDNVKLISIVLVAFVIALVIAKQRDYIINHTADIIVPILLTIVCYNIFLACGWLFARGQSRETRISFATCSMFNNVALGVSIALLHFPQNVILFVAVSEMAWAMLPIMFRWFLASKFSSK
jgi:BASS family bile acid:Na+ symporter